MGLILNAAEIETLVTAWPSQVLLVNILCNTTHNPLSQVASDDINNKGCGIFSASGRIVGGHLVRGKDQIPWVVQLVLPSMYNETYNASQFCGGSIISAHFVLTASHCVAKRRIYLDEAVIIYNSTEKLRGSRVGIAALFSHPSFIPGELGHDIALAKTAEPFTFDRFVRPVCLPWRQSNLVGRKALISGWGRVSARDKSGLDLLRITQTILPYNRCKESFSKEELTKRLTPYDVLCARTKGKGICKGDSGGPLTVLGKGGKAVQVGVAAFAYGCAHPTKADFYTRVSTYVPWIREQLAASEETSS
ncbi:venom peptide isomerase heavy chain-like isoform X1 [Dermacentor andersoni]|uniref:venom peptide isomerase heavy chain-like isoform X1 n=1 Tax=Dermacentor andersoni TaxID=34620 RepID=UPI003B3B607D